MFIDLLMGAVFVSMILPVAFPDEVQMAKNAAQLVREQMAASARSTQRSLIKGYRTQADARRHRVNLRTGEVIYFPNGTQTTTETGLNEAQIDGWWYAWNAR